MKDIQLKEMYLPAYKTDIKHSSIFFWAVVTQIDRCKSVSHCCVIDFEGVLSCCVVVFYVLLVYILSLDLVGSPPHSSLCAFFAH